VVPPCTEDQLEHGLELAYGYLNRRERTEAELRGHLQARGVDAGAIDASIGTLRHQGYVDDERFARLFTQDKRELEEWGSDRIRRALLDRGVERELVEATLSQDPPAAELDRALELLRRRFPSPPADRRERERALGLLIRKGYDGELAIEALAGHARDAIS
jgi:regulatory protein